PPVRPTSTLRHCPFIRLQQSSSRSRRLLHDRLWLLLYLYVLPGYRRESLYCHRQASQARRDVGRSEN
ncbi:hypothetical protein AAVH_41454, partial [Aphelenchoides avenae]